MLTVRKRVNEMQGSPNTSETYQRIHIVLRYCKQRFSPVTNVLCVNPDKHLRWSVLQRIVDDRKLLIIFAKRFVLDVSLGYEYAFAEGEK